MNGLIFNIQRYSIHDGGGIRTIVFFKGCPLHCPWCSNPESQSFEIEKVKIKNKCIHCSECSNSIEECPSGAITEFGRFMSVEEIIKEVVKDSIFYTTSGGGVTLSGGEVLSQPSFALELLKSLKELGINTALETCGQGNTKGIKALANYLDLILFDLKIMDETKSEEILGAHMHLIKNNLKTLVSMGKKVIPRVPLIPNYTLDNNNINQIINFVNELGLDEIHILPFHQYGSNKYEFLDKQYLLKDVSPASNEEVEKIKTLMEQQGLKVIIGGL
ncbi:[formate-C-acetyltransferase]-activating enzyme [Clostridium ganghwense]|uniref:[formate-C-acetyltransferase]-activating enzyme n=1 Tax=Clostridium ganghwense TaxID=312089 RepID=A0ABT4CLF7_9CLOT|nr:[formate-C-acetyltransferase]-activating enzyme [Clostridium ganghwense]MCY6369872.1 [formate-C-acetyltransferase]-activating enzyme [Clostridium ganghwense]